MNGWRQDKEQSSFGRIRHPKFSLNLHTHRCTSANCETVWICFADCKLPEKATCPECWEKRLAKALGMDDEAT